MGSLVRAALQRFRVVEVDCGGTCVAQLDVDVDGCNHREEVCVGNTLCHCFGPALCSVDDL